jgi:membrane-associated phospholipid phosphatase
VIGALVLAAAIGLSRIYLRAHYWSDVAGGWGIGFGVFGLLGVVALVVDHIRHNGRDREPEPAGRAER